MASTTVSKPTSKSSSSFAAPKIATRAEWLAARKELLAKEKAFTRTRESLAATRRELPWVKVEKNYVFDGPRGKQSLADLFNGKSQLIIYHFMFGPDWEAGCPGCSFAADGFNGSIAHVEQRDISFAVVSRAAYAKLAAFEKRMGWNFHWVSSGANDFNFDYQVTFTPEELAAKDKIYNFGTVAFTQPEAPGLSAFVRDADGNIYHTYSTYGRGLESLLTAYDLIDCAPRGRNEQDLPMGMAWVKHHDKYGQQAATHACCEHKS